MKQLTQLSLIIMIGLNSMMTGCGLFGWDPPNRIYLESYENQTNQSIQLVFIGNVAKDSFNIDANSTFRTKVGFVHNGNSPINEFIDDLYASDIIIRLYSNNQLHNEWSGPAGNFGDTINDPFNYDSWELELYQDENHEGTIIFTITEEDIN